MGKSAKPISQLKKAATREEWEARTKAENEIKVDADELIPPGTLNMEAKAIFEKTVEQGMKASLWDNLDLDSLVRYADGMARFNTLADRLNTEGVMVIDEKGVTRVNSCYNAYLKTQDMLMRLSGHLGLTTIDRLKFVTATTRDIGKKEENKFLKILQGNG